MFTVYNQIKKPIRIENDLEIDSGCSVCLVCGNIEDQFWFEQDCPQCSEYGTKITMTAAYQAGLISFDCQSWLHRHHHITLLGFHFAWRLVSFWPFVQFTRKDNR